MRQILAAKFGNNRMGLQLIDTYDATLTEGNTWHDNFWGICRCDKCIEDGGENWLGTLLMQRRKDLHDRQHDCKP